MNALTPIAATIQGSHRAPGAGARTVGNPVRLAYDSVAGAHLWLIPFSVGGTTETHRVRWDNVWLSVS